MERAQADMDEAADVDDFYYRYGDHIKINAWSPFWFCSKWLHIWISYRINSFSDNDVGVSRIVNIILVSYQVC